MKGNAGECQVNVRECRQSARGMQGNAGECKEIQGNARRTYGSWCKMPGEWLGNVEQFQGNVWEWVQTAMGKQGNAGDCQGNI